MTPELWRKIDELYHAACEHGRSVLAGVDPEVRREVEALLDQNTARVAMLSHPPRVLAPGMMLGPYRMEAPIGKGGMGEVWRARDTRLGRDVAIKLAHQNFSERFEREARAIASLNHPNICTLYDVGPNYLVMELVDGETLAGPLPVAEVLRIGRQIGEALMAAHDANIVHRDLKPANIKIRPDGLVKVLDFGLASLIVPDSVNPNEDVTIAARTAAGMIVGSPAWMSPEQARGQKTDKRTDIWAFGVVLYELSTGERLFTGQTLSDTIAQVLTKEPDLARLPAELKPLVSWCLEKDVSKRLRDIADARPWLGMGAPLPVAESRPPASRKSSIVWPLVAAAALLAAGGLAAVHFRERPAPAPEVMRFEIRLPEGVKFETGGSLALSPDGRQVAFPGVLSGGFGIFVQDLNGGVARQIPNAKVSSASPPFSWSPDGAYIAYSAAGPTVNKVEVASGAVEVICAKPGPAVGSAWSRDGTLIFGSTTSGLWRVPASGGSAMALTRLDASREEVGHQLPIFLPDGKHYLFFASSAKRGNSGIFARSLDDAPEKASVPVVSTGFGAHFVPGATPKTGWVLYLRDGVLMAQALDLEKLSLTGQASPIPAKVGTAYQSSLLSASAGVLVYRSGGASSRVQLTWVDGKTGKDAGIAGEPGRILNPRLSPDEKRVAYIKEDESFTKDLWILDLERGGSTRLTFGGVQDNPVWSPDGSELAYGKRPGDTQWRIVKKRADGAGPEELVLKLDGESVLPSDWSLDGRFLVFERSVTSGVRRVNLGALELGKAGAPMRFSGPMDFNEGEGRLSPDGHYLAYSSNETGRVEIYVRVFSPGPEHPAEGKWLISNNGGAGPAWSADGKRLLWHVGGEIMAVSVDTSHGFRAGTPEHVYSVVGAVGGATLLSSKGQGLYLKAAVEQSGDPIRVLVNWMSAIKRE